MLNTGNNKNKYWLILLFILLAVFIAIEARDEDDYFIYLSGSSDLFKGQNIYTNIYNSWYHYLYSVFFAIILYPLTLIPYYLSKIIWLSANIYFLYRIFILCYSYLPLEALKPKNKNYFIAFSVLFCLRFINDNFHCGQISLFLFYLCLQGLALIKAGNKFAGALLISLAINIKIMPLVIIPYLFYRKEIKAAVISLLLVASFIFIPSLVIGHEQNMLLLNTWWDLLNPTNERHILDIEERSFHSISTFIAVFFTDTPIDPYGYGTHRNIMHLGLSQLALLINTCRLLLIAGILWFLKSLPFRAEGNPLKKLWELSYLFAVMPLIFPHQHHYAFAYFIPATIYLLYYAFVRFQHFSRSYKYFFIGSLSFIYLCFNLQLLLGEFRDFYEHYKLITFGALYGLILLAISSPAHLRISLEKITTIPEQGGSE